MRPPPAEGALDVEVRPDPRSCEPTVSELRALAAACEATEAVLVRHGGLGECGLGGLSGIVYRHTCARLVSACSRIAHRSRRLADGLTTYAESVTVVEQLMDDALAVARPHLTVTGGWILSPGGATPPDHPRPVGPWAAWRDAQAIVREARAIELEATSAWVDLLHREPVPVALVGDEVTAGSLTLPGLSR